MPGYSGTPLVRKLGFKPGFRCCVINEPVNYRDWLDDLPDGIEWVTSRARQVDLIHLFVTNSKTLRQHLPRLEPRLKRDGMIWVSWYKQASKIPTDVDEALIRDSALALGLVDVKVCAVTDQWSGLKIVIRKQNR